MHATQLITPGILVTLCIGLVLFIVVYRLLFHRKK